MGSTEIVEAAARGELPHWARASPHRREHIARVAALMRRWAEELGLPAPERDRWVAVAWLHDALRDAAPDELRSALPASSPHLHPLLQHGPACAARLEGLDDAPFLDAIRYHTIGHPRLDRLGRALYLADFLEPGRDFQREWRAGLVRRMPAGMDAVLVEVVAARIAHLLEIRAPIHPETAAFWSSLVEGEP